MEFKETLEPNQYIIGWLFKGKYFKDEDAMRGMTMSEGNTPKPIYAPEYVEALAKLYKLKSERLIAFQQLCLMPVDEQAAITKALI